MGCEKIKFIRYPGGKQRMIDYISPYLPPQKSIKGTFVEPFVGGGAVFFALNPKKAILSDINKELIDLYRGIRRYPLKVWEIYKSFPETKKAYYEIRAAEVDKTNLASRAARILYLNRTCFKGMWRHNMNGEFNVGYGGQDRRWVISEETLLEVSKRLKHASMKCTDFEKVIDSCMVGDLLFVDPPYRPGEREMVHAHYMFGKFTYSEHQRLSSALKRASERGVKWIMTTTAHPEISSLFSDNLIVPLPKGTGKSPGRLTNNSGEVLICNYVEGSS